MTFERIFHDNYFVKFFKKFLSKELYISLFEQYQADIVH